MRCRGDIAFSRSQFGEIRNARQSAAASHSAHIATYERTISLDGGLVKTRNCPRPHPECPFWRKIGQRMTRLLQQIPVVSAQHIRPHRTVTPSPLGGAKLTATRRGSTLCCPGLGYTSPNVVGERLQALCGASKVLRSSSSCDRTMATKVHSGASFRPRHTPSESKFSQVGSEDILWRAKSTDYPVKPLA